MTTNRPALGKCDQQASLDIDGFEAKVCLEGRVIGATPTAGSAVVVRGRQSAFGLLIEEIRLK